MKVSNLFAIAVFCASGSLVWGQVSTQTSWIGVWNGTLEGLPGVILTLADDHGQLGGTIVLNGIIERSSHPHIGVTDTLMVNNPQLQGDTLLFQVTRSDGKEIQSAVKLINDKQAEMRCLNCEGSPTTALVKFVP